MMDDAYFLRIVNPIGVRRNVLESSKLLLENLKGYQRVREVREEKLGLIAELRRELQELSLLVDKLREQVPEERLKELVQEAPESLRRELQAVMDGSAKRVQKEVEEAAVVEGQKRQVVHDWTADVGVGERQKTVGLKDIEETLRSVKEALAKLD